MLELLNINKTFNMNAVNQVQALANINVEFRAKEWTYIIGSNGSGKSTLLKVINHEVVPDYGHIDLNSYSKEDIFFVDQITINNLVPSMSIYENLLFGLRSDGLIPNLRFYKKKKYKNKIISILKEFNLGLEKRLNEQVRFLSGGEQQIIIATRILLSKNRVLAMDEFTSSLDQKWAPFILKKLKKHSVSNDVIVIAVTHDFGQINNIGDRLILLNNGKITEDRSHQNNDFTPEFILNLFYEKH